MGMQVGYFVSVELIVPSDVFIDDYCSVIWREHRLDEFCNGRLCHFGLLERSKDADEAI